MFLSCATTAANIVALGGRCDVDDDRDRSGGLTLNGAAADAGVEDSPSAGLTGSSRQLEHVTRYRTAIAV